MDNELIIVRQLPVIEEQLIAVKPRIEARVKEALSLVCTEDTVKIVKKVRTEINKEFEEFENRRKSVKEQIMKPYDILNATYEDCVRKPYEDALRQLSGKIADVEDILRIAKEEEVKAYFDEYAQSRGVPFADFKRSGVKVNLSASKSSLKDAARQYIDRLFDDVELINAQEHKDEVLYEYQQTLNVSKAITTVINRHRVLGNVERVETVKRVEVKTTLSKPKPVDNTERQMTFTVVATIDKLKELKTFLEKGEYKII